jgi:hypothetical protein
MSLRLGARAGFFAVGAVIASSSCLLTSNFDGLTGNEPTSGSGGSGGSSATSSSTRASTTGSQTTTSTSPATSSVATTSGPATSSIGSGGGTGTGGDASVSAGVGGAMVTTGPTTIASSSTGVSVVSSSATSTGATMGCTPTGSISGPFPATCVFDDFNRADGSLGMNWQTNNGGAWSIASDHVATTVASPETMLWSQKFGPDQEAFYTILTWDPGDGEIELILKAQGAPMECNSVLLDYMGGAMHAYYCDQAESFVELLPAASITLHAGDQIGARVLADGTFTAYQNGHQIGMWSAAAFDSIAKSGTVGFYASGVLGTLAFDDVGGGGD